MIERELAQDDTAEAYIRERAMADEAALTRWWHHQLAPQEPQADISLTKTAGSTNDHKGIPGGLPAGAMERRGLTQVPAGTPISAADDTSILGALRALVDPPVVDRILSLFGGTPGPSMRQQISSELQRDPVAAALPPERMERLLDAIEGGMTMMHGTAPTSPSPDLPPKPHTPEAPAAKQLTTGEGLEDVAARVNMARIQAQERTKAVLESVNKLNVESGATGAAVRGVVSHQATEAAAKGKVTAEQLIRWQPGQMLADIPLNEQITAARRVRVTSARYLEDLAQKVTQGDQEAANLIYDALAVHGKIDEAVTGMSAELGRGLEAMKIAATSERGVFDPGALGELADRLRGVAPEATTEGIPLVITPERLAQMITTAQKMGGRQAVDTMARQAVAHPRANALLEAWINGLLSGPQTHAANFASNSLTTFWAMPERILAARLHPGVDAGVMKGEAAQMAYGLVNGFTDALVLAGKAFKTGVPQSGLTKLDFSPAITAEALNLSGVPGRAVDLLGTVIRTPGRFLMAGDEFFKGINYRMELHAQAFRQAAIEGLDGDAMARRIQQIINDPPASIKDVAEGFAAYQTFTSELGDIGQGFLGFANSHPAIRLIVPFVRTPTNIFKYAMERTPLLNLMAESTRAAIKKPGPARDLALARMSMGGMLMATIGSLAASGTITGDGPHNPQLKARLRETGWQPYSVKVGDTYYSYNRLDPVGMLMGLAANISEISGELPSADLDQLAMAGVLSTMEALTSKTYLQGIANVLDAIKQPDQAGVNFLRGMARSIVPAGVAQLERVIDPHIREANGLLDEMRARVPGWSADLPPRRNLFGEAILLEGGLGPDLISPIYRSTAKDDPVAQEIVKHRIALTMPSKYLGGSQPPQSPFSEDRPTHGVELTPQEYDLLIRLAGNELKGPSGRGMHDELAHLITTDTYQRQSDGPDGGKAFMLKKLVQTYREAAKLEVRRSSPMLDELVRERFKERQEQRLPNPEPDAVVRGLGILR